MRDGEVVPSKSKQEKRVRIDENVKVKEESVEPEDTVEEQFMEAMLSSDWLQSPFHKRLYNTYVRKVLSISANRLEELIENATKNSIKVEQVTKTVRRCDLCDQVRTITKRIDIGNETIYSGKHCAEKFIVVMDFYIKMNNLFEGTRIQRDNIVHSVLGFWEGLMNPVVN